MRKHGTNISDAPNDFKRPDQPTHSGKVEKEVSATPYLIIDASTADDLSRTVNYFIKQGYTPLGGPFIDPEPEYMSGRYKQAVVKS